MEFNIQIIKWNSRIAKIFEFHIKNSKLHARKIEHKHYFQMINAVNTGLYNMSYKLQSVHTLYVKIQPFLLISHNCNKKRKLYKNLYIKHKRTNIY